MRLKQLFMKMFSFDRRYLIVLLAGMIITSVIISVSVIGIHYSSETEFCMLCHEMRIVAEQGWMRSPHYENPKGVIAECKDCHIPPELAHMLWTKTRDGAKDVFVHYFGASESTEMDWEHLRESARRKIFDSSCMTCHSNLTPKGSSIKTIIAHRAYQRMNGRKRCVDCHTQEFHGKFKEYLFGLTVAHTNGGDE